MLVDGTDGLRVPPTLLDRVEMHPRSIELGRPSGYEHIQGKKQCQPTSGLRSSLTKESARSVIPPKRTDVFKEMAKKCGATVRDAFWTLGEYDMVAIVEAPDDISMTAPGLSSGALGNVRTQTLRAFTQAT